MSITPSYREYLMKFPWAQTPNLPPLTEQSAQEIERLWTLLPDWDAPYSYDRLSKAETEALVEALGDGFGDRFDRPCQAFPLPKKVSPGLLDHVFYYRPESEQDKDDRESAFWSGMHRDFPFRFDVRKLDLFFGRQFQRFHSLVVREEPDLDGMEIPVSVFEILALNRVFQKPWYELHAVLLLASESEEIGGMLGRLVEQYFWRFLYERAAMAGAGVRKGASAGGREKAIRSQKIHSNWQVVASEIWARRPDLTKNAVAKEIRKQSGSGPTAKHIARYIVRP
jgi:hypothetical protein